MARRVTLCVFALVLTAGLARAQDLPKLTTPVNDFAHVIDQADADTLDRRIRALKAATGDTVVVATVPSMAPFGTIDEYAVRLFEQSGIGQRDKDNGVLIVIALAERKVRIEVGYGLEEFITDGFAGDTIRGAMLPSLRQNNYGAGLVAGATRVIQRIAERRGVTLQDVPVSDDGDSDGRGGGIGFAVILLVLLIIFILRNSSRGSRPRGSRSVWPFIVGSTWSGWSGGGGHFGGGFGGGGGGGFGGFGGGRSGGGGASGGF